MIQKYPKKMRVMHWLMAIIIITLIAVGWYMDGLPDEAPNRMNLYNLHKSFGVLAILLFVFRFLFRLKGPVPAQPAGLQSWEKGLAHFAHWLIYGLIIAVPVVGFMMSDAGGHPVVFFGYQLPDLISDENKALARWAHRWHSNLAYVLLGVLVVHVLGALKHWLIDKNPDNNVFKRIW